MQWKGASPDLHVATTTGSNIQHRTNNAPAAGSPVQQSIRTLGPDRVVCSPRLALPVAACTARMNGNPLRTEPRCCDTPNPPQIHSEPRTVPAARQLVSLQVLFLPPSLLFIAVHPEPERWRPSALPPGGAAACQPARNDQIEIQNPSKSTTCASFGPCRACELCWLHPVWLLTAGSSGAKHDPPIPPAVRWLRVPLPSSHVAVALPDLQEDPRTASPTPKTLAARQHVNKRGLCNPRDRSLLGPRVVVGSCGYSSSTGRAMTIPICTSPSICRNCRGRFQNLSPSAQPARHAGSAGCRGTTHAQRFRFGAAPLLPMLTLTLVLLHLHHLHC